MLINCYELCQTMHKIHLININNEHLRMKLIDLMGFANERVRSDSETVETVAMC